MKTKTLKISIILICVISIGIYSIQDIYSYRNDITVVRTMVKGEMPEIDGLELIVKSSFSSGLTNKINIDKNNTYRTDYSRNTADDNYEKFDIHLKNYECGISSNYGTRSYNKTLKEHTIEALRDRDFEQELVDEMSVKVLTEMISNDERNKIIRIKDYLEYMPVYMSHETGDLRIFEEDDERQYYSYGGYVDISDCFKFPIPDDMKVKYEFNYGEEFYELDTQALAPRSEFIIYDEMASDYSNIFIGFSDGKSYKIPKENNAIYVMPLKKVIESEEEEYRNYYTYDKDSVRKIFDLKEDESLMSLELVEEKSELWFITRLGSKNTLYVMDSRSFDLKNEIELYSKKSIYENFYGYNGMMIVYDNNDYDWVMGDSKKLISGHLPSPVFYKDDYEYDAVYYKDKLCIVCWIDTHLELFVLDEAGDYSIIGYDFPKRKGADLKYIEQAVPIRYNGADIFYSIRKAMFEFVE